VVKHYIGESILIDRRKTEGANMTRRLESKEYVEIACEFRRRSNLAMLIHDGVREAWIPFSLIESPTSDEIDMLNFGQHITLLIPEWLAKDKGLI
jgi:hypothetical protein